MFNKLMSIPSNIFLCIKSLEESYSLRILSDANVLFFQVVVINQVKNAYYYDQNITYVTIIIVDIFFSKSSFIFIIITIVSPEYFMSLSHV